MEFTARVREILSWYPSVNPGTKTNIARMLNHGRLAGSGKMVILPVDQGFEHGPSRSFGPNPAGYDPEYHIQLAIDAGCNAYAAPLGFLEAVAGKFAGQIPLILKLNNSDTLSKGHPPCSSVTGSVKDASQPSRDASFTLPVTAEQGGWPLDSVSLLLSFRMSGICPAYFPATASRKPSGAAYALQPASMASWMWYSGSYPAGLGAKERAGPCSNPWSTGRITILPEPASRPWLSMRAMLVLVPGLSEGYQLRISRTRAVNSMSASRSRRAARLPAASGKVQGTPCPRVEKRAG